MAWEISMSAEGWEIARERLEKFSKEALICAICDDLFEHLEDYLHADTVMIESMVDIYSATLYHNAPHDALVDKALELIERHNTCDNGGSSLWIDRQGIHKVFIGEKLSDGEILR